MYFKQKTDPGILNRKQTHIFFLGGGGNALKISIKAKG